MKGKVFVVLAAGALVFVWARSGCSQDLKWSSVLAAVRAEYSDVEQISTDSLARALNLPVGQRPVLLDTREPAEYAVSHIAGAVWVGPELSESAVLDSLDRDAPVVAYCSVGYRSSDVARKLEDMGFTNVSNLEGSIFKWANEGRPVVRDGDVVREVHPFDSIWGRLLEKELRYESDN